MIEIIESVVEERAGIRVEIRPRFLCDLGRKLYVVAAGSRLRIPDDHAHAHGSPDRLVPIAGRAVMAYQTPSGRVERLELLPGREYVVPPNVPHQLEIQGGGFLESLFPTAVFEQQIPMRELAGGFFRKEVLA